MEIKKATLKDPAYDPNNMTEELKEELHNKLLELHCMKDIAVHPNNRPAVKAADAKAKAMAQDVHPHLSHVLSFQNPNIPPTHTAIEHGQTIWDIPFCIYYTWPPQQLC